MIFSPFFNDDFAYHNFTNNYNHLGTNKPLFKVCFLIQVKRCVLWYASALKIQKTENMTTLTLMPTASVSLIPVQIVSKAVFN